MFLLNIFIPVNSVIPTLYARLAPLALYVALVLCVLASKGRLPGTPACKSFPDSPTLPCLFFLSLYDVINPYHTPRLLQVPLR